MKKKKFILLKLVLCLLMFFMFTIKTNAQSFIIKSSFSENPQKFHETYESKKNSFTFSSIRDLEESQVSTQLKNGDTVRIGKVLWEVFKPNLFDIVLLPLGYIGKSISVSKRLHRLKKIVKQLNTLKKVHGKIDVCQKVYKVNELLNKEKDTENSIAIKSTEIDEKNISQKNYPANTYNNRNTFNFNKTNDSVANNFYSKIIFREQK